MKRPNCAYLNASRPWFLTPSHTGKVGLRKRNDAERPEGRKRQKREKNEKKKEQKKKRRKSINK